MNRDTLSHILDLARWAPSGDNTQPWRSEIVDDALIRVHWGIRLWPGDQLDYFV